MNLPLSMHEKCILCLEETGGIFLSPKKLMSGRRPTSLINGESEEEKTFSLLPPLLDPSLKRYNNISCLENRGNELLTTVYPAIKSDAIIIVYPFFFFVSCYDEFFPFHSDNVLLSRMGFLFLGFFFSGNWATSVSDKAQINLPRDTETHRKQKKTIEKKSSSPYYFPALIYLYLRC